MQDHPLIQYLLAKVAAEAKLSLGMAVAWVSVCGILAFVCWPMKVGWAMLLAMAWLLGIWQIKETWEDYRLEAKRWEHWLFNEPQRIVWIYTLRTEILPFGIGIKRSSGYLFLAFEDGNRVSIALPAEKLMSVSKTLQRLIPHAAIGFNADREALFLDAPQLLRKQA